MRRLSCAYIAEYRLVDGENRTISPGPYLPCVRRRVLHDCTTNRRGWRLERDHVTDIRAAGVRTGHREALSVLFVLLRQYYDMTPRRSQGRAGSATSASGPALHHPA